MESCFIENKYRHIYDSLCARAVGRVVLGYTEKHHILPKSLGGRNTKKNLVRFTIKEHIVAHLCLARCTVGIAHQKMVYAARLMTYHDGVKIPIVLRDKVRREHAILVGNRSRGRVVSLETRQKMSIALKGHLVSEETQNKIRISQMGNTHCLGRQLSLKTRQKISRSHIGIGKGIPLSIEQRHKQSETNKRIGRRPPIQIGPKSTEHKQKIAVSIRRWWKKRKIRNGRSENIRPRLL